MVSATLLCVLVHQGLFAASVCASMKKNARVIGCVSSQPQQVMLLKSLLNIAGDRAESGNIWTYSDSGHLDAVVMDFDDGSSRESSRDLDSDVMVAMSRDLAILSGQQFALHKPLRSRDVVHLLELLDQHFDGGAMHAQQPESAVAEGMQRDERLNAILALLRRKNGRFLLLDFGVAGAFIDIQSQKVFLEHDFPLAVVAGGGHFNVAEVAAIPPGRHVAISAADFFYEYTLAAKQASLVDGLSLQAQYHIRQWPQFLKSSNTKALIKISAYFSRRKATINAAAQDLLVGIQQIEAYLNAAYVQGLLMVEADPAPVTASPSSATVAAPVAGRATASRNTGPVASVGLFGKLRQKLGL